MGNDKPLQKRLVVWAMVVLFTIQGKCARFEGKKVTTFQVIYHIHSIIRLFYVVEMVIDVISAMESDPPKPFVDALPAAINVLGGLLEV